jgi:hypothetical protein
VYRAASARLVGVSGWHFGDIEEEVRCLGGFNAFDVEIGDEAGGERDAKSKMGRKNEVTSRAEAFCGLISLMVGRIRARAAS